MEAFLLMANYAITDSAAITVRYSEADYIDASTATYDKAYNLSELCIQR